ncbi:diaminopimelate epimerase [Corynebacterium sp. sy039]|uniref:diaminopimelate epimerase n=1 Tax=Corynebacterium sp. sy039 TaxID=2599641 RepID=UPI0011B6864B|nr:diaminopimelate epimerase [Corynebacterium sp. sy039]QDZ42764.1 diaminopimelate epimerase [Corynebacterium sp. sy039]
MKHQFAKGHGTENDFVIVPDHHAQLQLEAQTITAICDRRAGIGGDGLLRVSTAGALLAAGVIDYIPQGAQEDDWFMDYYNADGSTAEMCGNGVRVFAHWIRSQGLVQENSFRVITRAGVRSVTVHHYDDKSADISVDMGQPRLLGKTSCTVDGQIFHGVGIDVGNPHLAAVVPEFDEQKLRVFRLTMPEYDQDFFPQGVNVELLTPMYSNQAHMRVYERGVGETRSCGTGTVAAACAALEYEGKTTGVVEIIIPGGVVTVTITPESAILRGPSQLVAVGELQIPVQ